MYVVEFYNLKRNVLRDAVDDMLEGNDAFKIAERIARDFQHLLCSAGKEEDVQIYLRKHPSLIYTNYRYVHPKLPLGAEMKTDFVFVNAGHAGADHVFVEIEKPDKKIFHTKDDNFHADYTQAKGQLTDWKAWLRDNISYLRREKLPDLSVPKYHLIMGRSSELNQKRRTKIHDDIGQSDIIFSTYDDLLEQFRQIVEQVRGFRSL